MADGPQSVIRDQVRNGVAVRMAVLEAVIEARNVAAHCLRDEASDGVHPAHRGTIFLEDGAVDLARGLGRRAVRAAAHGAEVRGARADPAASCT